MQVQCNSGDSGDFLTNCNINGHIFEQVMNMKDLGVIVSKDLSLSKHIEGIVKGRQNP